MSTPDYSNATPASPDELAALKAKQDAATDALALDNELRTLRIRGQARALFAAEQAGTVPPFDAGLLVDVLARPAEPAHRVEGLIPSDAGTLIVAQRKTGKTTLLLNLARALIGGADFLGRFPVRTIKGRVAILNYEVSAGQLARWADDAGVPADRCYLVNLRGRRNPLSHGEDRQRLAEQLVAHDVETVVVDPFGRAYGGASQNDSGEVGAWLADLDRWARAEVGARDVILTAHAGWDGERTRGASALEDWADSIITMVRDKDDDQVRYLRAEGRDVLVEEDRLNFDTDSRTLRLAGAGSRKSAAKTRNVDELVGPVVQTVTAHPGITGYKLGQVLRESGAAFQRGDEIKAVSLAVERGQVIFEVGPRRSKMYRLAPASPSPTPTYPDVPRGDRCPPTPTSYIGEVGGGVGQADKEAGVGQAPLHPPSDDMQRALALVHDVLGGQPVAS